MKKIILMGSLLYSLNAFGSQAPTVDVDHILTNLKTKKDKSSIFLYWLLERLAEEREFTLEEGCKEQLKKFDLLDNDEEELSESTLNEMREWFNTSKRSVIK